VNSSDIGNSRRQAQNELHADPEPAPHCPEARRRKKHACHKRRIFESRQPGPAFIVPE